MTIPLNTLILFAIGGWLYVIGSYIFTGKMSMASEVGYFSFMILVMFLSAKLSSCPT